VNRFRAAASATLLALLVAACGPASSADETPTEEPTAVVTPSPAESDDAGGAPSFEQGAGALDDILPDEVGGIPLEYQFAEGAGALGTEGVTPEVQDFMDRVGADMDDVRVAFGIGFDQTAGAIVSIFAVQVAGADEDTLRDEFRQVLEEEDNVVSEDTIAGKNVLAFGTEDAETDTFLYVHDDVVFMVGASSAELTEEALSLLP
jgi:hypothetical protein